MITTVDDMADNRVSFVATAMVGLGPRSWIGGLFNRSGNKRSGSDKFLDRPLTPLQVTVRC